MPQYELEGKVALVTGATDGIGKETARKLAAHGAQVLLHGRNRAKADRVASEIRESTRNRNVETLIADFTSLTQVRNLAAEVKRTYPRLQILINNAGIYNSQRKLTEDGFEETFQVHYLAPFLLTDLLRDLIEKMRPSRIVNVTSVLHKDADLDFANLQGETWYEGHAAYATSKLALTLFTFELAARIPGPGISVNCVHPGGVDTKLLRAGFGPGHGMSPADGAEFPLFVAADKSLENVTGKYFERDQEAEPDRRAFDLDLRNQLWAYTETLLRGKRLLAA